MVVSSPRQPPLFINEMEILRLYKLNSKFGIVLFGARRVVSFRITKMRWLPALR